MTTKPALKQIPVESLCRGKYQPRQVFNQEELQLLADTIAQHGLIQPLVVRPLAAGATTAYEIVAGERRWRAAQLAGLAEVPCLVRDYSDEQAAAVTTVENTGRVDLNPVEEALAYQRLIDEFHYLHEDLAAVVGKSRSKVTNMLRLLKLCPAVQTLLIDNVISEGHGKLLAALPTHEQLFFAHETQRNDWSVRDLEKALKKAAPTGQAIIHASKADLHSLERSVSEQLGTEAVVENETNGTRGWLKIRYYDLDTLAGLLERMQVEYK